MHTISAPASPPFRKEGQGWFVIFIELTLSYDSMPCICPPIHAMPVFNAFAPSGRSFTYAPFPWRCLFLLNTYLCIRVCQNSTFGRVGTFSCKCPYASKRRSLMHKNLYPIRNEKTGSNKTFVLNSLNSKYKRLFDAYGHLQENVPTRPRVEF